MTTPLRMPGRVALDEAADHLERKYGNDTRGDAREIRSLPTHDWESVEQAARAVREVLREIYGDHDGDIIDHEARIAVATRLLGGPG